MTVPFLGFALVRPQATLYSMVTLLDVCLSCRGSKFSFLTMAEALEVGLNSLRADLLGTTSSLFRRSFWWGSDAHTGAAQSVIGHTVTLRVIALFLYHSGTLSEVWQVNALVLHLALMAMMLAIMCGVTSWGLSTPQPGTGPSQCFWGHSNKYNNGYNNKLVIM